MGSIKSQRAHLNNKNVVLKTIRSIYHLTIGVEENAAVMWCFLLLVSSMVSQFDSLYVARMCVCGSVCPLQFPQGYGHLLSKQTTLPRCG